MCSASLEKRSRRGPSKEKKKKEGRSFVVSPAGENFLSMRARGELVKGSGGGRGYALYFMKGGGRGGRRREREKLPPGVTS